MIKSLSNVDFIPPLPKRDLSEAVTAGKKSNQLGEAEKPQECSQLFKKNNNIYFKFLIESVVTICMQNFNMVEKVIHRNCPLF